MSMPGLPPLPKSLSGFELAAVQQQLQYGLTAITEQAAQAAAAAAQVASQQQQQQTTSSDGAVGQQAQQQQQQQNQHQNLSRKPSTLDTQLSILRREMVSKMRMTRRRIWRGVLMDGIGCLRAKGQLIERGIESGGLRIQITVVGGMTH